MAAAIALLAPLVVYPIQARYTPAAAAGPLLVVAALHVAITGLVLLVSLTRAGARHADRLSVVFVLGVAANLLLYVHLLPVSTPTYPSLAAYPLTCLLIAGAVLFAWSVGRIVWVGLATCAAFALIGVEVHARGYAGAPFVITVAWLAVGVALAAGCARALGAFRANLLQRQKDLTALSDRLMSVQEEQLRRLSRELHDELGQSLTAVSSYLWLLEQQLPAELGKLRVRTGEARRLVARTLGQMRELSQLLRPPVLDLYGLVPSLEEHLRSFERRHRISTTLVVSGLPERLAAETETAIYRITQEALTNVVRHAQARRVRVRLGADGDRVRLEVQDDGRGFPHDGQQRTNGVGLIGIRERVRALGGTMTLESRAGVQLAVRLPLGTPRPLAETTATA
jgi:signal transduction histidine kinase